MEDNKPRYIVTLSDGNAFQLTEQEYKSREDAIFGKDKGATVARINDYSIDDDIDDNAAYTVTSGDNTFLLSADEYKSRRDKIRRMDGIRVGSLSHIDYWGNKLNAINDEINSLKPQRESALAAYNDPANNWDITADPDDIDVAAATEAAKRSMQAKSDLDDVDARLDKLYRDREANPAWQEQRNAKLKYFNDESAKIDGMLKELNAANEESAKISNNPLAGLSTRTGDADLAWDMRKNPNYYRGKAALTAAKMFYADAVKTENAPSRYDDSKTGFGNFFRGLVGEAPETLSAVALAKSLGENIPLAAAIKQVHEAEGKNANIVELVTKHPERLNYLSPAQKEMLTAFVVKSATDWARSEDISLGYQAGSTALQSLGFMADFFLVGGLGEAAAKGATKGITKAIAKASVEAGLKGVQRELVQAVPKFLEGTIQAGVKTLVMSPFMPSSYANLLDNIYKINDAGQVDLSGRAIRNAIGDVLIENLSESAGTQVEAILGAPFRVAGKAGIGNIFANTKFGAWGKALKNSPMAKIMKQAGWNGYIGEIGEEWYGNALRVMTTVDPDALKNFATVDQQIITHVSFAPMSLIGGVAMPGAQFLASKKQVAQSAKILSDVLAKNGYDEQTIQNFLDVTKAENPTELAAKLAPVINQAAKDNKDAPAVYKAVMDYADAIARYRTFDGISGADAEQQRQGMLNEISAQTGFTPASEEESLMAPWIHQSEREIADGETIRMQSVRVLTDENGKEMYVIGTPDANGDVAVVDRDGGAHHFANVNDASLEDSGEMSLNDYLDRELVRKKQTSEQERMTVERQQANAQLIQQAQPGVQVNLGTTENPEMATILGVDAGNYIVQKADGTTAPFTPQEMAEKLGIETTPKTDAQIEEEQAARLEGQNTKRTIANNEYKGLPLVWNDQQYTLVGVTRGNDKTIDPDGSVSQEHPFDVHVKDANGKDSVISMTEDEFDVAYAGWMRQTNYKAVAETPAETTVEETPAAPVEDNTPRDFRGNPLPMRTNKRTGQQVVDENALWNKDPEAWARWNDNNPNQRVTSKERLEAQINDLDKQIEKDTKAVHNAALKGIDADKMDDMEADLAQKVERRGLLASILDRYNMPAVAGPTIAGEQRKAAAEQTIAQQEAGFPGIQQKWNNAPKVVGTADEIRLANGETISGHYVLTEAAAPTPSHDPANGFAMTEGFPVDENGKTVNDRDYEHDKAAQQSVVEKAANYDQRALQTPVIVSNDGVVLSGNDRTMASQIAAANNTDGAYTEYLTKYSQKYGFTAEQVGLFQHPRVVFVPDTEMPYNAATFAKFNADDKKSQSKTEKAVKAGKTLTPETLGTLASLVDRYDDINALYNDAAGVDELLNILLAAEVITPEQVAALKDGERLSGTGMDLLESTLIGAALDEEAVRIAMADANIRKSVVSAIAQIIVGNTLAEYNLRAELTDAIQLVANGKRAKEIKFGESVQSYVRQQHLFADDVVAEATVQMLADAINDRKTSFLKKVLSLYNRDAVESASGQMNLLTGDVLTREAILRNILEYLGYDTNIIFDTSEREAEQRAAAEQSAGPAAETGPAQQNDAPVQGDEGSGSAVAQFNREEVAGILEQGNVGETGLAEVMTDEEVAEFMRLWDAFLPHNDALGEAYNRLGDDLRATADKAKRKAAQAEIDRLEQAQNEAFAPLQDYVDSLLKKYELSTEEAAPAVEDSVTEEVEEETEDEFEDEVEEEIEDEDEEPDPDEPKPTKGKKGSKKSSKKDEDRLANSKFEKREGSPILHVKGGATNAQIDKQTYTQEEYEEFIYGHSMFSTYESKKTGEKIEIVYVDDQHPIYNNHQVMFWRWEPGAEYGDRWEAGCTTDYILKYLKANKFKCIDKKENSTRKNKYGFWINRHGYCTNPIRIQLPSVRKGWANFSETHYYQDDNGKWYADGSASHGTGGGSLGVKRGPYDTKSAAIKATIEALERFRKANPGNHTDLRDVDNLIRTLKTKTLPQALMEEGALNNVPRAEITASELDNGVQGLLFGEEGETIAPAAEEKPKRKRTSKKKAEKPAASVEETSVEDSEEENEPQVVLEDEEGTPGNFHWVNERVCTNPIIIAAPGLNKKDSVSKIALAEKDGKWYVTSYVVNDSGKGTAWGTEFPSFKSNYVPYSSRYAAVKSGIDGIRWLLENMASKYSNQFGYTWNNAKELVDYLVKMELPASQQEDNRIPTIIEGLRAFDAAKGRGKFGKAFTNLMKSVGEMLGFSDDELNGKLKYAAEKFRTEQVSDGVERAKAQYVRRVRAALKEETGNTSMYGYDTGKAETPVQETAPVQAEVPAAPAYGSQNKLVTTDQYEELKKKMLAKLKSQLNAGFDPEILAWGAQMAMYHVEAGARKFIDFSQRMIRDLGEGIRPYLQAIYNGARYMPGMEELRKDMDSAADVEAIDVDAITIEEPTAAEETPVPAQSTELPEVERPVWESRPETEIQGLEGMSSLSVYEDAENYINDVMDGVDGFNLVDMIAIGSRAFGTAKEDSDLDILIEYDGDMREDAVFNILNEEHLEIMGIKVDFFPIRAQESGTLTEWLESHDNGRPVAKEQPKAESSSPVVREVNVEGLLGAVSDMYQGKRSEVKLSDFAEPVQEQPSETSGQTVGELGKYTHTKTGKEMSIVRLTGDRLSSDEFKRLKARAKEFGGYYSSFGSAKGFLFDNEEDAIKFNNINTTTNVSENTDRKTASDTAIISSEAASVASKAESLAESEKSADPASVNRAIQRIDDTLDKIDDQLALLGYYEADTSDNSKFHESYGFMKTAEKKAVKDADRLAKKLAADLGIDVGRKTIAKANIAPAGGDISFRLQLPIPKQGTSDYQELYVNISLVPDSEDNLYVGGAMGRKMSIMYRLEDNGQMGLARLGANNFAPYNVSYADLLAGIRSIAKDYLREAPAPAEITTTSGPVDLLQLAKEQAEKKRASGKSRKKSVSSQEDGDAMLGGLFDTLYEAEDSTPEVDDTPAPAQRVKPTELNGYKVGDKVVVTEPDGTQHTETITRFDDGKPVVTFPYSGGAIIEEKEWEQIRKIENEPVNNTDNGLPRNDEPSSEGTPADGSGQQQGVQRGTGEEGEVSGQEGERTDRGGEGGRKGDVHGRTRTLRPRYDDSVKRNTRNYRRAKGDEVPKTVAARYKANIAAIRLLKELQDSGKQATKEQMAVLRQYTGWGGLGGYFNNEYSPEYREMRSLLTDEEMQAAALSINTAYYTPTEIIESMWDIAKRLGFEGGNVLEGSAGIGNILASMPKNISEHSAITAVELDNITGGILQLLYPDANVQIKGFQEVDMPNGSVDLAITNVPFGDINVYDSKEKDLTRKFGGKIHDFCIAKNIRKLAEGGIGIFISTRGTLDGSSKALRQWIVNEGGADVIGAFRLNNATFEGTKATSDIIVVRKRVNGQVSPNAINVTDTEITRRVDYQTNETEWNKTTRSWEPITGKAAMELNSYFVEHPENMGGEMGFGFEHNDTYRPGSSALWPTEKIDQNKRLAKWAKQFSSMQEEVAPTVSETESVAEDAAATKEGQLITNSKGEICISRSGKAVPIAVNAQKVKGYSKAQVLADYDALKTAINEVLDYQLNNESDEGLKPLIDKLNKAYDRFATRYDRLNRNTAISFLRYDVDFPSIAAVEDYKEKKGIDGKVKIEVKKTSIFSGRVLGAKRIPTPSNAKDGVIVSINQFGRIDIPFIAEALNKDEDDVRKEILASGLGFENPLTGNVEVEYEYLSGNVREKLEYARAHNTDGQYDKNIEALEKVIPADIPAHLIEFSLGSDWMPVELYTGYAKEKFGVNDNFVPTMVGGSWILPENTWEMGVNTEQNRSAGVHSEKLRTDKKGHELMIAAMNNTSVVFSRSYKDPATGETITEHDKEATQAATTKMSEMRDDFKEWCKAKMLETPELAERISKIYNDTFNAIVPKEIRDTFIPEHFDGMATKLNNGKSLNLRQHQAKAVIRATTEPLMMAHEVGTGKTFTLIATAMEMRRLGTAKKPMIVVQNATLGQFVSSAKELYPNAKILTISEADRTVEGRSAFYAKIKYNDWDMIVVPQSVFEMIPDSEERQRAFIQEKIDEKKFILEQAKEAKNSTAERQLKKELEDLEYEYQYGEKPPKKGKGGKKDAKKEAEAVENAVAKAKKQLDRRTDDVSDFDDMGIDALLIDEAHSYKHLGFSTAMQRGVKGVDATGSKKSAGVYLKTRAVFDKVGWKNVVFATGTPISNTAAEIWTFMKYLMPADVMRQHHIYYFDDFVRNFGNISQSLEFTTSGKFKETTRFASYTNLPELIRIWSSVTDTVRSKDAVAEGDEKLEDKQPKMEGGQARDIYLPQSLSLVDIMNAVRAKLEWYEGLSGKEKKENSHIPLTMFGIAKMAAIDPRLVDRDAQDEPNSKTNKAVEETLQALKDSERYKGTAALFCDNFRRWDYNEAGKRVEGFNIFEEIKRKLVAAGVPEGQIVIMKSGMTTAAKEKIFARVNSGEVRVIMGTTATLGTGVNIQERLFFEAHLDAPNRPMDYTQRNGRILRQGNLHKEWGIPVRVVRFGVEDSLDVTAYQRLSTKAKFIDSIMDGKPLLANGMENRVLEEEDEGEFDNPVAVLSGSQYALLKSQAERELRKLRNKKEQHRQDQIYIERTLKENKSRIAYDEKLINEANANLAKVKSAFPGGTVKEVTIEGRKAKGTEQIAQAIKDKITTPLRSRLDSRRVERGFTNETLNYTMTFDGVPVNIKVDVERMNEYDDKRHEYRPVMRTRVEYSVPRFGIEGRFVQGGYTSIKDIVPDFMGKIATGRYFEDAVNNLTNTVNRLNSDNELMLQRRGKPFADEEKLAEQEKIVADYTEKMKAEMAEKEAKYAEMAKNATTSFKLDNVEVDEDEDGEGETHNREADENAPKLNVNDPLVLTEAVSAVNRIAKRLGLRVVFDDKLKEKGAYTEGTDYVRINLANCESVDDAVETLLHEGVAHFGLRELLGEEGMKQFIADILAKASPAIRTKIEAMAAENGWSLEYAAEEYVAELAQKTDYTRAERSFWREILQAVRNLISRITGRDTYISDDVIREMLVASYANLEYNANFASNGKESEQNQITNRRNSRRVSQYRASAVQISRDRSDIRVLEPEYTPGRNVYPEGSEGDYQRRQDREKESARLIAVAKANGLYVEPEKWGAFGLHQEGNSMESEIYYDFENDRYVKVKDPYASEPMTQNAPADAIYQHIIHNIYFPEARYEFLGISEKNGDVRIVIAQKAVKTFEDASPNEAKDYLLKRGYTTKNSYEFENDEIVVTDLEEENLLVTRDDKGRKQYHPIDPIIKYKIPAAEIIERAAGGEEGITHYRRRTKPAPKKTGIGYKVFYRGRDGKLYPPMVANPNGEATPVGVWLDADEGQVVGTSKTGRKKVKAGGKGTQGGSGTLAYRPGWHLGSIPYALQFNRGEKVDNPLGLRSKKGDVIKVGKYFPRDFVWAEVEYAADKDWQSDADATGINKAGNFEHSLVALPHIPTDGYYSYRTNPNPATDPWIITGAMKVNRVLTDEEVDNLVRAAGRQPQEREPIVRNRVAEGVSLDERQIAASLLDRFDNQDGGQYPWISEGEDFFNMVEEELPYTAKTEPLFAQIDKYRRLAEEDFNEGMRDFSGGEMRDIWEDFMQSLRRFASSSVSRNRVAEGVEGFLSNAEEAVRGIAQEKATPQQWLKMIESKGGLKAGEDKWVGLSDWLKASDKKTLTKQEVLEYINENKIQIEEVHYMDAENIPMGDNDEWEQIVAQRYGQDVFDAFNFYPGDGGTSIEFVDEDKAADIYRRFQNDYDYDYQLVTPEDVQPYSRLDMYWMRQVAERIADYGDGQMRVKYGKTINPTRLDYTTEGLDNKREIALTVPTIEPWNESDEIHFGDAGEGRAIAWARFGDAVIGMNGKALFIDEIQSKRHQEGREKGYREEAPAELPERIAYEKADKEYQDYLDFLREKYGRTDISGIMNEEEGKKADSLFMARNIASLAYNKYLQEHKLGNFSEGVSAAPFEKNWHELAMKRMLRLAAEEGYDYLVWTTGEQQAERYEIGGVVDFIQVGRWYEAQYPEGNKRLRNVDIHPKNGYTMTLAVNEEGKLINGEYEGRNLSELIGKELAVKVMEGEYGKRIEGDDFHFGGEGMKGFYDEILPRFMNKYAKKWGVQVEDKTLYDLENGPLKVHAIRITPEMKESVMKGQLMFREGTEGTPFPASYTESMGARRLSASETARKCGIEIEFRPSSQMQFNGKPLAGRWINGKMYICLEHCRDAADAVRTVLHEGVGHNGLRRLIGDENMTSFCLDMFRRLPENARRDIADAAVTKYGGNVAEATEEYLAERAEVMDFENEDYERSFWDIVLDGLRKVLAKIGIDIPLSQRDVRWLMWQSYNANKQTDVLNEAKRQVVAKKLGFTLRQLADEAEGVQIARNKIAEEILAPAARIYNKDVVYWMNRLHETWVDKDNAVHSLVSALEKATGKAAAAFEDIRLALNQQSSKGLAAIEKWERENWMPMQDAIKALMQEKGCDLHAIERYVMIKHGLERNEVFAKRDAKAYYQDLRDAAVAAIDKALEKGTIDQTLHDTMVAKEDAKLDKHVKAVDAGTDVKYKELRKQDYGGLTALYSEWDAYKPFMEGVESEEEYKARVLQARHPKYTYIDAEGREKVDMAATEEAAMKEVEEFEKGSEKAVEELWKRINNATKATLKHQYDANMMSRQQYLSVSGMFKYYVPLRGFADNTAEDMYDYYMAEHRNDFEPPLLKAKGRKTEAESPFGYIGSMASSGIAADMKNETKLTLYYFVSNRAANDLVTVSEVWYKVTGMDELGRKIFSPVYPPFKEDLSSADAKKAYEDWEKVMQEDAKAGLAFKGSRKLNLHNSVIHIDNSQKESHVIKFKVGGRDMMMYINGNPRAAQAINNELNVEMSTDYQKVFGKVLRWFSGINTSYNPEFWLSNAQRDALFALMSVDVKEDSEYGRAFRKNFGRLLRDTLTPGKKGGAYSLKRKLDSGKLGDERLDKLYKEFVDNGGVTGYTTLKNNEEWELELRKYTGQEKKAVAAVKTAFEAVQNFGEAIEQMTRFAAYITSREQGKEIKDAVNDAKELTVNFNRKGSGKAITFKEAARLRTKTGHPLNPVQKAFVVAASWLPVYGRRFIMFFNASVQGLNAMYKLFKKDKRRMGTWAAAYVALGVIQAVIHGMLDDDDDYLDIPDYERRNNLLLGGKGVYFKWALPQEARVFYGIGDMAVNHIMGRTPHRSILSEILESASDIAPLNPAGGISALAPSAVVPIVEVALNRDYKGSKIYNDMRYLSDEEKKRTPKYTMAYQGTGKPYILLSQFANWLSGGDYADAGWFNINPASVEHILQGATGGAGTTIGKFYKGTVGQVLGEDFTVRSTPFLSRILTVTDDRYRNAHTTELFDYYKAEAEHTKKLINTYIKNDDDKKLDKLYDSEDYEIMQIYESYKGMMKYYSDELKYTTDKAERKALMREQDALRKEMIQEISDIGKN